MRTLRLPVFATQHGAHAALAANEAWTFDRYLLALCELELAQRRDGSPVHLAGHRYERHSVLLTGNGNSNIVKWEN